MIRNLSDISQQGNLMQIREVVVHHLRLPLTTPYRVSFRTYTEFEPIVVEIRSTDGRIGWGEAYVPAGSTKETTDSAWRFCIEHASRLPGRTAFEARRSIDAMVAESPFACCAMLTALAVLECHPALNVRERTRVPLLVPIAAKTPKEIAAEVESRLAEGYRTVKVKVGWEVCDDLARVRMVQDALAGRGRITMDANRGYSLRQGLEFVSGLDPRDVVLFEQPCEADEWDANAAIARACPVPLMLDESIRTEADIERAAKLDNVKFVKLKLKRVGGVERALSAMTRARDAGLSICLGDGVATELMCWVEACVSRGFLRHAGDMNGFLKPKVRLLANPLPFEQGSIVLEPNYWPEVDRGVMRAHEVRSERFVPVAVAQGV
jgi:L-alanine-DL-glutamate epimerase-like enolase superfamily enzyme